MSERIRFVVVGTSKRSDYLYGPLLALLRDEVEFVGIWGCSEEKSKALGEKYGVPWFTDLERMMNTATRSAGCISVNGATTYSAIKSGLLKAARSTPPSGCASVLAPPNSISKSLSLILSSHDPNPCN